MPRVVRNFWVELQADGQKMVAAGPKSAGGGFTLTVYQRNRGEPEVAMEVRGTVTEDGRLVLRDWLHGDGTRSKETHR